MPTVDTVAESDHHLLQRVANGDAVAWARLVERNAPSMLRAALAACGNRDLADDALQEAFLLVRTAAASYRARGEDPERTAQAWLVAVAANVALHLGRGSRRRDRRERRQEGPIMAITATGADPAAIVGQRDNAAWIRGALAELSESDRRPLVLRYFAGLDHHGLAAALGCSPDSARARVHRALTRLRKRLGRVGVLLAVAALSQAMGAMAASAEGAAPTAALFGRCNELIHVPPAPAVPAWAHPHTGASTMTILGLTTAGLLLTGGAVFGLFSLDAADTTATTEPRSESEADAGAAEKIIAAYHAALQAITARPETKATADRKHSAATAYFARRSAVIAANPACAAAEAALRSQRKSQDPEMLRQATATYHAACLQAESADAEAMELKAAADAASAAHQAAIDAAFAADPELAELKRQFDAARPAPKKGLFGG